MYSNSMNFNINELKKIFNNDFAVKFREFESKDSNVSCCIVFIEGMVRTTTINEYIIRPIVSASIEAAIKNKDLIEHMTKKLLICDDVIKTTDMNLIVTRLEYGDTLLIIDGVSEGLIINTKGWEKRSVEEPKSESSIKGPQEGFTESILLNTSLLRRKILNPDLKFEYLELGSKTKTKVCISYIDGIVSNDILDELKKRLDDIDIDAVMDSQYIKEFVRDEPFSPFNTVGSTERPDIAAGKLLEGRIAIFCDGTPNVLTVPYLFIEHFQANEDYYGHFIFATLNRWLRILCFILSTSTPAIYIALITFHQQMLPTKLFFSIATAREGVPFPSVLEISVMLITFEILREAGVRLPKNIGQAISIVGALVLGEAAVSARLISAPMVIVTAITGIATFAIPNMMEAMIILRFLLLIISSFFGLYGYIFGVMGIVMYLMGMRSFGVDYMTYITPVTLKDVKDTSVRVPWWLMEYRPKYITNNRVRRKMNKRKKE